MVQGGGLVWCRCGEARFPAGSVKVLHHLRRIHDPRAHVCRDAFPDAGREQHEGRRDLAKVVHHGVGLLDEVDLHPAQQTFAHGVDLFHEDRKSAVRGKGVGSGGGGSSKKKKKDGVLFKKIVE